MAKPLTKNTLFYGDNLPILREHIPDESIDLIYLDPPFNSSRSYNVLFKDESGKEADAQITAFEDTWHWGKDAERTYYDLIQNASINVVNMIGALRQFIGTNQMMAYLTMMTARLIELHRVLKPTGSIYLHCDPTASHYLKIVLDTIFGTQAYRNEITWKRSSAHSDTKQGMSRYGRIRDLLLFYTKTNVYTWNPQYTSYDHAYLESEYRHVLPDGQRYKETDVTAAKPGGDTKYDWHVKRPMQKGSRWQADLEEEFRNPKPGWEYRAVRPYAGRYWAYSKENMIEFARSNRLIHRETGAPRFIQLADEMPGVPLQDLWTDIPPALGAQDLGYPTQKPIGLLERIINTSSNPSDVILDPFCGCGTAIVAAEKLKRKWIGIDITHLSISLMKYRLKDSFGLIEKKDYGVIGEPESIGGARQLAKDDRYQFQWWALSLVQAKPLGGESGAREGKKGSDKGIDGVINFVNEKGKTERILIQVKSGHVKSGDIRDLRGVLDREESVIGIFITLEEPSKDMMTEAVSSGYYHSDLWQKDYPRIQILTIEDLLSGKAIDMPRSIPSQFKQAEKVKKKDATQGDLF